MQCEAGLVSVTGTPEEPAKVGISIADIAAGHVRLLSGILTALYERERTGEGTTIEVSMLDALGEWMGQPALLRVYGGSAARRTGARHAVHRAVRPVPLRRRRPGLPRLQNEREWAVLCEEILGRPDLAADARFATNPTGSRTTTS